MPVILYVSMSWSYSLSQAPVVSVNRWKMVTRGWEPRDPPACSGPSQDPPAPQPTRVPLIAVCTPTLECSSYAESSDLEQITRPQSSMVTSNEFQRPPGRFLRMSKSVHQPKVGGSCLRGSPPALAVSTPAAKVAAATKKHRLGIGCSRDVTLGLSEPAVAMRRKSQPGTRARLVVATRSGRGAVPVLDSLTTSHSSLARKTKGARSTRLNERNGLRKRSNKSRLEGKATSQFCSSDESLLLEGPTSCDRRRVRVDGMVGATPDDVKTAAKVDHEEISEDLINLTPIGLRSSPVMDWWRNQGVPHALDGKTAPSEPSDDVESICSAVVEAVGLDGVEAPDGGDSPWTKPQLHSLRVAQMETVPSATDFWGAVSSKVNGRGPHQCQQKWFELFSAPKIRRGKAGSKCSTSQETEMPIVAKCFSLSQEGPKAADSSPSLTENLPGRADGDDLFQSTPMRGRSRFGMQLSDDAFEARTPKTPAGPCAPFADASAAANASGDERADYKRGVSKTYVQALSKKMRKARGASQMCSTRVVLQEKAGIKQPSGGAGRTIHAAATSRGQLLKASMAASGTVRVESTGSGDSLDEVGSSDDAESDDE